MPDYGKLNANERRYLPSVEDALNGAGLRPTNTDAEYRLEISLEDGPVNADSTLTLYRGSSEIARSYARVGGPSIIFSRSRIVQESFDKCLRDFETKLPRSSSSYGRREDSGSGYPRYDDGGNYRPSGSSYVRPAYDGEDNRRADDRADYDRNPDWQRGY